MSNDPAATGLRETRTRRQRQRPIGEALGRRRRNEDLPQKAVGPVGDASTTPDPSPEAPRPVSSVVLRRGLFVADAAAIVVGVLAAFLVQEVLRPVPLGIQLAHLILAFAVGPVWLSAMAANKLYMSRVIERPSKELHLLASSGALGVGAMLAIAFAFQYEELSRLWIFSVYIFVVGTLAIERRVARRVFAELRSSGRINRRVAIIGTDAHAIGLLHTVQRNPGLGYDVVGFIGNDDLGRRGGKEVIGSLDRAADILREHLCVGAMISLNSVNAVEVNRLTRTLTDEGFHIALSTSLRDIDVTRMRPQGLDGQTLIYVEPTIRTGWREYAKRAFDVTVAATALIVTGPLLAVSALLIRRESEGPILFRQERVGRNGERFQIIKLRTMFVDAEARKAELLAQNEMDGPLFKMEHDPRITRVGRVLRKLSIDEFPQFWNVLRGEMSVVGPRPALPDEVEQWDAELHDRLRVLPGITGMWQVSGRSTTTFDEYKRLDLYYVDNWSLLHDVRIVSKTFGAVLFQRGAS